MNVTSARPTLTAVPAPARTAATAPAPPASTDIATLDSPAEAALLPGLNAAAFLLNFSALQAAASSNVGLTSTFDVTVDGSQKESLSYSLGKTFSNEYILDGKGQFGGKDLGEKWSTNAGGSGLYPVGGMLINGSFGHFPISLSGPGPVTVNIVPENLVLSPSSDGLKLDGNVSGIEVHETIRPMADGKGVRFDGTVGGQAMSQTLTIIQDDGHGHRGFHVEGNLGNDPIRYDETLTGTDDQHLQASGKGVIGGYSVEINHKLTFDPSHPPQAS